MTKVHWMYVAIVALGFAGYFGYKEYERMQTEA